MFEKYLIEKFIPWSLNSDFKNAIGLIEKEKEKFICDMYNHFALSFKELSIYELHMFRVTSAKLNTLNSDIISITLNTDLYHSIHIVYDKEKSFYFIINKKLELINEKIIGKVNSDFSNLHSLITNYIFKI